MYHSWIWKKNRNLGSLLRSKVTCICTSFLPVFATLQHTIQQHKATHEPSILVIKSFVYERKLLISVKWYIDPVLQNFYFPSELNESTIQCYNCFIDESFALNDIVRTNILLSWHLFEYCVIFKYLNWKTAGYLLSIVLRMQMKSFCVFLENCSILFC